MKEIKIEIEGKEYKKTKFTGKDWLRMLEYTEAAGNNVLSKNFFEARYSLLSDMLEIPIDELYSANLEDVTKIFKEIETGITAVFFGVTPEEVNQMIEKK